MESALSRSSKSRRTEGAAPTNGAAEGSHSAADDGGDVPISGSLTRTSSTGIALPPELLMEIGNSHESPPQAEALQTVETLLALTPEADRAMVRRAHEVAAHAHRHQKRSTGEPYITHPLAVAHLVGDLNLDGASIAAALLHDVLEDTEVTSRQLGDEFPHDVVRIVDGVTKISRIKFETRTEAQSENLRKLFLAMAQDIRVVLVKLCDRLHNMRTLKALGPEKRIEISRETLDIFAPLAGRLGITRIKRELEDSAMRWISPDEYRSLKSKVQLKAREREALVNAAINGLKARLEPKFPGVVIYGRSKHFYSIHKKMATQGLSFDEIYDLNAIRIVCMEKEQCYRILGEIHDLFRPLPGRLKDYISNPKNNGYQSLHTTVIGAEGEVTEVQIRTLEMHRHAEYGIAAHWMYKEQAKKEDRAPAGTTNAEQFRNTLNYVRELVNSIIEEGEEGTSFLENVKGSLIEDVVYCFTPKGDCYELPVGATPIDFAFMVHTDLGFRCVGAKINKRMVNLRTELKNGDVVDIITSSSGHPSRDWLQFVKTPRARNKVQRWLKSKERAVWIESGAKEVWGLVKEHNLTVTTREFDAALGKLAKEMRYPAGDDLLVDIGFKQLSAQAIFARLFPKHVEKQVKRHKGARKGKANTVVIEGMEDSEIPYRLASCCHPIPGEKIVAFVTRGRGISIHRESCSTLERNQGEADETARVLSASWSGDIDNDVRVVPLMIEAGDRSGLLNAVTGVFAKHQVYIDNCNTRTNQETKTAYLRLGVQVHNLDQLQAVLDDLMALPEVRSVERTARAL
ncbi:MAG: bifunctional (p)ppGpp synthetase/guanosine-3',5'-bis(diphosphate) 3'-pyrophosphohydrolase [Candidatus Sumerlaeia bacterium]|nr:bifunctional (p)ppGpp synthetase/guanosine-3',5'-bis(diphosphate) 3'-pyrophosphohydrolase [Candidatus Sumerlaeia bacterium]